MQIDWFTLVAQIINFLILLWLLQRFLYGPIMRTMEAREEKLAAQFAEAEAKNKEATEERAALQAERQGLAERREELMQAARGEAADRRRQMIQDARQETEALMARWYDAIDREKQAFLREVQARIGQQTLDLVRRALADLAGAELEQAIVGTFIERLKKEVRIPAGEELKETNDGSALEAEAVVNDPVAAQNGNGRVVVRSSFALPAEMEEAVVEAIKPMVRGAGSDADKISFEQDSSLICGIEVNLNSRRIAWSIRDYLAELERNLDTAILQSGLAQAQRSRESYADNGADEILPG